MKAFKYMYSVPWREKAEHWTEQTEQMKRDLIEVERERLMQKLLAHGTSSQCTVDSRQNSTPSSSWQGAIWGK